MKVSLSIIPSSVALFFLIFSYVTVPHAVLAESKHNYNAPTLVGKSKLFQKHKSHSIAKNQDQSSSVKGLDFVPRGGAFAVSSSTKEKLGVGFFVAVDILLREVFKSNGIHFPSQLAGCLIMFALMLISNVIVPGSADSVFNMLSPGAGWLAKWLPVMFVPGLVMLPIAPSVGSSVEVSRFEMVGA